MSEQEKNFEKRRRERADFETEVYLKVGDSEYRVKGSSKDLSIKGVFVYTDADIPLKSKCHVEIVLTGTIDSFKLQMEGTVIRKNEDGMAIVFESIDLDSYTHLKNLLMYNV